MNRKIKAIVDACWLEHKWQNGALVSATPHGGNQASKRVYIAPRSPFEKGLRVGGPNLDVTSNHQLILASSYSVGIGELDEVIPSFCLHMAHENANNK